MGSQMHQFDADLQGRPQLNFDVLRLVCDSLTAIPDVLSFARTCSALTGTAFRRRLKMSPINLEYKCSLDSFERFIFADQAARAPHIYGLRLPRPNDDPQIRTVLNARLVAILQAAVHLQYIHLSTSVHLDPVLTAAANMTSLRELHIFSAPDSPWSLLSTFRSPLRTLRINEFQLNGEGVTAMLLQNHLANFAPSLEVLDLANGNFDIPPSLVTTQFTAVRSLKIYILNFNQFTVEILQRLFPNLDALALDTVYTTVATGNTYPDWREVNKEVQKTRVWPRLDHIVCDAECPFLVALLGCSIRRMDLVMTQRRGEPYLASALRHNYPQHLNLSVSFYDGLGDLDDLFPSEGADTLTHLVMFADFKIGYGSEYQRNDREVPWTHFRDKLVVAIRHLRCLTHLRLIFHYDLLQHNPPNPERDSIYTAGETDLQLAAAELAGAIPTLQYIFLTACGRTHKAVPGRSHMGLQTVTQNRWLSSKTWWVVHDLDKEGHPEPSDGEPSCMELSKSAAEKIMYREELHLPSHECTLQLCDPSIFAT